jgi:chorismate mutase
MLESHVSPDHAWSDKNQQITPVELGALMKSLTVRKPHFSEEELTFIELMRQKIAKVDDEIFSLLSKRMVLSQEIGSYKKENEITILQHEHWKQIIASRLEQSKDLNLTPAFIRELMDAIHQESIRQQTKVMYQNGKQ